MKNKIEKKVYKVNKKLLKKVLIVFLIILFIGVFAIPIKNGVELLYLKSWKWHNIDEYNFSICLPRAYKDIDIPKNDSLGLSSSAFKVDTSIEVNEEYVSKKPEIVYNGGNILNGVSLKVQALKTEKTTRSLDDIAESYYVLATIYYEDDYVIGNLTKEYVKVLNNDAIRASIDIANEDEGVKRIIAYLVPLQDKEITISFMGNKENVEKSMDEIEKIIEKIK